jgi:uncharacterized protein YndB with AHSA1/START domain
MGASNAVGTTFVKGRTTVERKSDREMVTSRVFDAPARIVFDAWTRSTLFSRWWVPQSAGITLLSCEMDVRVGGGYRLEFAHPASPDPMAFFGKYLEVVTNSRLVWTNEESEEGPVTTVTFDEKDGKTHLVMHERYPSEAALETATAGMEGALPESFEQLDELLVTLAANG